MCLNALGAMNYEIDVLRTCNPGPKDSKLESAFTLCAITTSDSAIRVFIFSCVFLSGWQVGMKLALQLQEAEEKAAKSRSPWHF